MPSLIIVSLIIPRHSLVLVETPLTLATALKEPVPVMVALINGGAHLDFRALDGCTPLHRATQHNNFKAAKVPTIIHVDV